MEIVRQRMKLIYRTHGRRLPDDVDYFISSAVECLDLPYDIGFWLQYFCPNPGDLINADNHGRPLGQEQHPEDLYVGTGMALERVRKSYDKWFNNNNVSIDEKMLCLCSGVSSIRYVLRESCKFLAQAAVHEDHEGMFYRRDPPNTKVIRRFRANTITAKGGHYDIKVYDWKNPEFFDYAFPKRNIDDIKRLLSLIENIGELPDDVLVLVTPIRKLAWRVYDRKQRKAIRRGVEVLAELIGMDKTKEFIVTRKLDIPAEKFTFRLKLEHLSESHGGVSTQVLVKDEPVCNLCIYTPDTPILDHVASVILHVRAGLEDDLINTGNPYSIKAEEPTGIEVLDQRLALVEARRERAIVVSSARPPLIIRIGNSPLTMRLQNKLTRRIGGYIYQDMFGGRPMPKVKLLYSYPKEITPQMEFQIPAGFIARTLGDVRNEVMREWNPR